MRLQPVDPDSALISGGDVRGIVEVCEDWEWKRFGDCNWTMVEATVVCRQMGYENAGTYISCSLVAVVLLD